MNSAITAQIQEIGVQIDAGRYPAAFNGGVLAPCDAIVEDDNLGAETEDEQQGKNRPAAGSRQWPPGRQGASGEPGPTGETVATGGGLLREHYLVQLDALLEVYPHSSWWICGDGMWLSVQSKVLTGLDRRATFLIAIPFRPMTAVRGWAFWTTVIGHRWIGPRHTNAVDGSICAFNPNEGTWKNGGSLVELIDHYTLWAFCHLHQECFSWWPGRQTAEFVYERLTELNDNEWCGCGPTSKRYRECCKQIDQEANRLTEAIRFVGGFLQFRPRQPPQRVIQFLLDGANPPQFTRSRNAAATSTGTCLSPISPKAKLTSAAIWAMPVSARLAFNATK